MGSIELGPVSGCATAGQHALGCWRVGAAVLAPLLLLLDEGNNDLLGHKDVPVAVGADDAGGGVVGELADQEGRAQAAAVAKGGGSSGCLALSALGPSPSLCMGEWAKIQM